MGGAAISGGTTVLFLHIGITVKQGGVSLLLQKRISIFALIAMLALGLVGCSGGIGASLEIPPAPGYESVGSWQQEAFVQNTFTLPEGFEAVGENNTHLLAFNGVKYTISVLDKRTGGLMSSEFDTSKIKSELNEEWTLTSRSLYVAAFNNMTKNGGSAVTVPLAGMVSYSSWEKIENGISVKTLFEEYGVEITVLLTIDQYGLSFQVPAEGVIEGVGVNEQFERYRDSIDENIEIFENSCQTLKESQVKKHFSGGVNDMLKKMKTFQRMMEDVAGMAGIEYASAQNKAVLKEISGVVNGDERHRPFMEMLDEAGELPEDVYNDAIDLIYQISTAIRDIMTYNDNFIAIIYGGLVSIDVLPFFGAAADTDKGFMFYPDGCGAISRFTPDHPDYMVQYNAGVYSGDAINIDLEKEYSKTGMQKALLPVMGVSLNGGGFVSYITKGDDRADLSFYPSGNKTDINRCYTTLNYRREVTITDTTNVNFSKVKSTIEKNLIKKDTEVKYLFLKKDHTDYSDMAAVCRDFMLDTRRLGQGRISGENVPFTASVLMGVRQKEILQNRMITMSTFADVKNMIDVLLDKGITDISISLYGWSKAGADVFPSGYAPASEFGGAGELKSLAAYAKEKGVRLLLEDNYLFAQKRSGESLSAEIIKQNNTKRVENLKKDEYLFNPKISYIRFSEALTKAKANGVAGISFDKLGEFLYYDYERDNNVSRAETMILWQQMMIDSRETLGYAASAGGAYTLPFADWLTDIPSKGTGYLFTSQEIPFYQMVVHGSIYYTSKPVNNFYDSTLEKLKMIEFGSAPFYILSQEDPIKLKNSEMTNIFSSMFEDNIEKISRLNKELSENLAFSFSQKILRHERSGDLVHLVYEKGWEIYINYSAEDIAVDGGTVGTMNYMVIGGEK